MTRAELEFARSWLAHVEAGRIGVRPNRTREQWRQSIAMERMLRPEHWREGEATIERFAVRED